MSVRIDLSLVIVSWNVKDLLKQCLKSIAEAQGDLNLEIFVVDNASSDGTSEAIENNAKKNLNLKLIKNKKNLGFAKANNQAIHQAQGEFILLLNPDMKLFPNTLTNMVNWLRKNPKAQVAGCHLVDDQSQTIYQVRCFPTVLDQLAIILKLPHIFPFILNKYLRKNFDYSRAQRVDSIRGGFFIMRHNPVGGQALARLQTNNMLSLPLLDERYFLWFEEVDFCRQIKESRGEVWYTPVAQAIDYVGQSFKQLPRGQAQKYFKASQLEYFKKWHPHWQYLLLKLAWPLGLTLTWLGEKLKINTKTKT